MNLKFVLSLEQDLRNWTNTCCKASYRNYAESYDLDLLDTSTYGKLKEYGLSRQAIISSLAFYGNSINISSCHLTDLFVVCWYWPNGEQVLIPINSSGIAYIGNSPKFWFSFYPFLQKLGGSECSPVYQLNLPYLGSLQSDFFQQKSHFKRDPLYIGGQSHFGHFLIDTYAPLSELIPYVDFSHGSLIIPPRHAGITKDLLLNLLVTNTHVSSGLDAGTSPFYEMPFISGFYHIGSAWILSAHHSPSSISKGVQRLVLSSAHSARVTTTRFCSSEFSVGEAAIIYISRFDESSIDHDRIYNWLAFKAMIKKLNIRHIEMTKYSLDQRISILSGSSLIISDSGSCMLNALFFSQETTPIIQIQSTSMLQEASEEVCSQHYKLLPYYGRRILSLECDAYDALNDFNPFYHKVIICESDLRNMILKAQKAS